MLLNLRARVDAESRPETNRLWPRLRALRLPAASAAVVKLSATVVVPIVTEMYRLRD